VAGLGLALTVLAALQVHRVRFDYNLLNLQSQKLSAIVYERKMVDSSANAVLSCMVMADSIDDALVLERRLESLGTVAGVDSVAPLLAGDQRGKLELVGRIREAASVIRFAPMDTAPVDLPALQEALASFNQVLGGALSAVRRSGDEMLGQEIAVLRDVVEAWHRALGEGLSAAEAGKLTLYQQALFTDLADTLQALRQQDDRAPLRVEDLPPGLRSRFIGRTGKLLLQVYPKENVWQRGPQEAFVSELRTVDPKVTGPPVRFYEFTGLLKRNFQKAALYALVTIIVMLLSHFRNVVCVLLALLPVLVGMLWTLGWMAVLGIAFNPANIIAITLLIGIGVSSGVHILNRFTEQRHPSILGKSTGKAVLVSALTTVAGFGSLMLAEHAGIASLGQVMALGTGMCMLAALTILPALLLWMHRSGWKLAHGWLSR
jgi:predicted RND superfamily exporter protein